MTYRIPGKTDGTKRRYSYISNVVKNILVPLELMILIVLYIKTLLISMVRIIPK